MGVEFGEERAGIAGATIRKGRKKGIPLIRRAVKLILQLIELIKRG